MAKASRTFETSRSVEKKVMEPEQDMTFTEVIQSKAVALHKTGGAAFIATKGKVVKVARITKARAFEIASDRRAQVTAASAAAGGASIGTTGAGVGLLAGGAMGAAAGILPAIFTFGLSIPFGAVVGGGFGLTVGGLTGTTAGVTAGGALGFGAYTKRAEIKKATSAVRSKVGRTIKRSREVFVYAVAVGYAGASNKASAIKRSILPVVTDAKQKAAYHLGVFGRRTVASVIAAKNRAFALAKERSAQVTAASAAGGAMVGGTGGAATGLLAGGTLGAVVGVVPAIFTFGLSIPAFGAIGAGCGMAAGTAVGSTAGAVVGGAGGYGVFIKREAIATKLKKTATYVKSTRARLVGSGTSSVQKRV